MVEKKLTTAPKEDVFRALDYVGTILFHVLDYIRCMMQSFLFRTKMGQFNSMNTCAGSTNRARSRYRQDNHWKTNGIRRQLILFVGY